MHFNIWLTRFAAIGSNHQYDEQSEGYGESYQTDLQTLVLLCEMQSDEVGIDGDEVVGSQDEKFDGRRLVIVEFNL